MTGLHNTDIRLADGWQLTRAADGDAPLCSDLDCLFQNIALEAVTQPGDVFYAPDFGWGLYDFIGSEDDELTRLEMMQRARAGLRKREVILPETVNIGVAYQDDTFWLCCSFQFAGERDARQLNIIVGAVDVEVVAA